MAKSLPPLIVPGHKKEEGWHSPGVRKKPAFCKQCKYQNVGFGFCPDVYSSKNRVALIFSSPSSDDINAQHGLAGKMGFYTFKTFIEPAGFTKDDLLVSHVIRCKPPYDKRRHRSGYPTGMTKENCEMVCRKYDPQHGSGGKMVEGGIDRFDPNVFIVTFDPKDTHTTTAYVRQIQRDVAKAKVLVEKGYRPAVLFGKEAAELFAPHIKNNGGLKAWRGDWFEGEYPKTIGKLEEGFIPA